MPWSGSTFIRDMGPYDGATCWQETDAAHYGIQADHHDVHDQDMADGINSCINRTGANVVQGNIPMGGFKLTGLAAGAAAGESVNFEQLESGRMTTRGDMLYRDASGPARLPKGTPGQLLYAGSNDPQWWTPGTAVYYNIGSSGNAVPVLDGPNVWSNTQTISKPGQVNLYITRADIDANAIPPTGYIPMQAFIISGNVHAGIISSRGIGFGTGGTDYGTTSDARLKHARRPIDDSGEIIDRLEPLWFRWGDETGPEDIGLDAQAVHEILPQTVMPGKGNPGQPGFIPWMRQHGRLEPVVIAELKALRKRVAELENAAA